MEILIAALRHDDDVLLPGEMRWRERQRALRAGTVDLDDKTTEALDALARSLDVELPW
jgi:LDH2 family malate/lactate/ureidoglycolate dehydrogenase